MDKVALDRFRRGPSQLSLTQCRPVCIKLFQKPQLLQGFAERGARYVLLVCKVSLGVRVPVRSRTPLELDGEASRLDVGPGAPYLYLSLQPDLIELERVRSFVDLVSGLLDFDQSRTFDIKVAVSEACANGIEHGSSPVELAAWLLSDRVLFQIASDGWAPLAASTNGGQPTRGLGLPLMATLADELRLSHRGGTSTQVRLTFLSAPTIG